MKRYKLDLTQVGNEIRPVMTASADGEWVSVVELDEWMEQHDIVGWQGEKKIDRLQRELRAAREAVGEGWFTGGATLAEAIRRKVRMLENRLADEHPPAPVEGPGDELRAECERLRQELSESRRGLRDVFDAIGLAERSLCNDRYTAAEHVRILTDKLRMATNRAERAEGRLRVFRENLDMGLGDDVGPEGGAR